MLKFAHNVVCRDTTHEVILTHNWGKSSNPFSDFECTICNIGLIVHNVIVHNVNENVQVCNLVDSSGANRPDRYYLAINYTCDQYLIHKVLL